MATKEDIQGLKEEFEAKYVTKEEFRKTLDPMAKSLHNLEQGYVVINHRLDGHDKAIASLQSK